MTPRANRATSDNPCIAGATTKFRDDRALDHFFHLVRHAGYRKDDFVADRAHETGSSAWHLCNAACPLWNLSLAKIVHRHVSATRAEDLVESFDYFRVFYEFHTHHLGNDVTSDVVLRWPKTTTHDDCITSIKRDLQSITDAIPVVANLHLQEAINSGECELFANPRRIGIDDLAEQKFRTYSNNFAIHDKPSRAFVVDVGWVNAECGSSPSCSTVVLRRTCHESNALATVSPARKRR